MSGIMFNTNFFYPKIENYRKTHNKNWIPKTEQMDETTADPIFIHGKDRRIVIHNSNDKQASVSRMSELFLNRNFEKKVITSHFGIPKYPGLPLFEADENESPLIIYHGPQAEIVFNSLGNVIPYPMKEPVPGEFLYPPIVPRFKAIPIPIFGTTARTPASKLNSKYYTIKKENSTDYVTMIPFYAHDAISDPRDNIEEAVKMRTGPKTFYNSSPSVAYEIPSYQFSKNYPTYLSLPRKEYTAYTKQEQVNQQPIYVHIEKDIHPTVSPENIRTGTQISANRQIITPFDKFIKDSTTPIPRTISSANINRTVNDKTFRIFYDIPMTNKSDVNINEEANMPFIQIPIFPKRSVHLAKYGGFKVSSSYRALPGKYYKYKKRKPTYTNFMSLTNNDINSENNYLFASNGLNEVTLEKPKAES